MIVSQGGGPPDLDPFAALPQGWLAPPPTLVALFLALYLVHLGPDEVGNPRLRTPDLAIVRASLTTAVPLPTPDPGPA